MQTVSVGSNAIIEVPFLDDDGTPVTPTGLRYVVLDASGNEVVGETVIGDLTGTSTTITVGSDVLGQVGGYTLELMIDVGAQTYTQEAVFGVTTSQQLQFLVNTFQTRASALFVAQTIPNITAWLGASKDQQNIALINAFERITRLNFYIPWPELIDLQNRIAPNWVAEIGPRMWPLMTPALWAAYPQNFRDAMNKAQVADANEVLTLDPYADRRRAGLMSESIGESSMMFRAGVRPIDLPVGKKAMEYLTMFLSNRTTTTRS